MVVKNAANCLKEFKDGKASGNPSNFGGLERTKAGETPQIASLPLRRYVGALVSKYNLATRAQESVSGVVGCGLFNPFQKSRCAA